MPVTISGDGGIAGVSSFDFGNLNATNITTSGDLTAWIQSATVATLFVDDSLNILEAAKTFGIKYVLAVKNPDSKQPHREIEGYPAISDYRTLIDDITNHPFENA